MPESLSHIQNLMKSDQGSLQDIIEIFSSQQLAQKNKNTKQGAGGPLVEPKTKKPTNKSLKNWNFIERMIGYTENNFSFNLTNLEGIIFGSKVDTINSCLQNIGSFAFVLYEKF